MLKQHNKNMKTKMKRQGSTELPRFIVGALAATTASSQAAIVQITLTGNKITSTGNDLVADVTGDGDADLVFGAAVWSAMSANVQIRPVDQLGGGGVVSAFFSGSATYVVKASFAPGGVGYAGVSSGVAGPRSISYLNPITFSDPDINNGNPTGGWLQVNAFNTSATSHTVQLSRLIFDDEITLRPFFASVPGAQTEWSAVPEPSSFALLALGAGGLLARRRRAA